MSETPRIEPVWLVEAMYAPDAAETRKPFRAEHLARLLELKDAGVIVEVGAFMDVSSSIALIRAESEEAALAVCRDDVYMRNGVWARAAVRAGDPGSGLAAAQARGRLRYQPRRW